MKIFFIRHGKDDNRYRGGWSKTDLIPEGKQQAKLLANYLKENNREYRIRRIISSDLPRAISTAQFISAELDLPIQREFQLREMNNGDLAGLLNDEALERYPGLFFSSLKMDERYPNGESPDDFFMRIKKWFDEFITKNKSTNDNVIVVTHGGVIEIIYHLVNGINWNNKSRTFKAANCSINVLNTDTMKFEIKNMTNFPKDSNSLINQR